MGAADLAELVSGPVLTPQDDGYQRECAVYNHNLRLEPDVVVGRHRGGGRAGRGALHRAARSGGRGEELRPPDGQASGRPLDVLVAAWERGRLARATASIWELLEFS